MANKTTDMSKIRKVLKFYSNGKSKLFISNYLSLSRNTVKKYISLFEVLGLSFEIINEKTDAELELLFSHTIEESVSPKLQTLYDYFPVMERELKKVGVTIYRTWEQYIALYPDGFQITQFRHHYKIWAKRVNPVMHMNHKAGDKMYVDYAGKTLSITDKKSGEIKSVQFFVDWLDDGMPKTTSGLTAVRIKEKIKDNHKFILLATEEAIKSKWCNWELGLGDAAKYIDHIAILPIKKEYSDFTGSEYLQIYPYIELLDSTTYLKGSYRNPGAYVVFPSINVHNRAYFKKGFLKTSFIFY